MVMYTACVKQEIPNIESAYPYMNSLIMSRNCNLLTNTNPIFTKSREEILNENITKNQGKEECKLLLLTEDPLILSPQMRELLNNHMPQMRRVFKKQAMRDDKNYMIKCHPQIICQVRDTFNKCHPNPDRFKFTNNTNKSEVDHPNDKIDIATSQENSNDTLEMNV